MLIFFSFDLFSVTLFSAKISTKFSHFSRHLHASFWFHAREIPKTFIYANLSEWHRERVIRTRSGRECLLFNSHEHWISHISTYLQYDKVLIFIDITALSPVENFVLRKIFSKTGGSYLQNILACFVSVSLC